MDPILTKLFILDIIMIVMLWFTLFVKNLHISYKVLTVYILIWIEILKMISNIGNYLTIISLICWIGLLITYILDYIIDYSRRTKNGWKKSTSYQDTET
jgi:hypothetical protein